MRLRAGGQLIGQVDGTGTGRYVLADGLGGTAALTDVVGDVYATYAYDAFGGARASQNGAATEYRFAGQQADDVLGLDYLRARYYDPTTGRFLSKDPFPGSAFSPPSLHRYAYVDNLPTDLIDPQGLCGELPGGLGLAECAVEWGAQRAPAIAGTAAAVAVAATAYLHEHQDDVAAWANACIGTLQDGIALARRDREAGTGDDVPRGGLKRMPDPWIDRMGGEEFTSEAKREVGRSKSDLYYDPDTGGSTRCRSEAAVRLSMWVTFPRAGRSGASDTQL